MKIFKKYKKAQITSKLFELNLPIILHPVLTLEFLQTLNLLTP